jgi:hypothetical protein
MSAPAVQHYQEVIDAIEQIYPDAMHFTVIVQTNKGRLFWDMSDLLTSLGLVEAFKTTQISHMMGLTRPGPSLGDQP